MVHEGGHAVHSFLSRHLPVTEFKSVPSEVAELASMSMELISMEHWETFFEDPSELIRAKREQLEKVLRTLPWVATIDKFQHWIYTHPEHREEERKKAWVTIMNEFSSQIVDWSGAQEAYEHFWQKQLHLFEVPFYYIEYGMAQLGAIALWKNYKNNPEKTLQQYKECLSYGYTLSIPELYKKAGIRFDFSQEYVKELADFVKAELKLLDA
jgi:oligoendopeptidase F